MDSTDEKKNDRFSFCPYCGKEIKSDDGFCEHCESYLGKNAEPKKDEVKPKPETKMCRSCFSQIPKSSSYCPICGKIADTKKAPEPEKTYDNGSFGTGFALAFFLGVIGFLIAYYSVKGEETKRGAIQGLIWGIIIGVCVGIIAGCGYACYVENLIEDINSLY